MRAHRLGLRLLVGVFMLSGTLPGAAQFAPRAFKLKGVPESAGASRAAWTQTANGAWLARCYGGVLRQEGERWKMLAPPASELVVQLAPFEGGLVATGANSVWLHDGREWRRIFEDGEIKSALGDGAWAFFATASAVFSVDRLGQVRQVLASEEEKSGLLLHRVGRRIVALGKKSGLVAVWDGSAFVPDPTRGVALQELSYTVIRGPGDGESFLFDGQQAWPTQFVAPDAVAALQKLTPQWHALGRDLVPGAVGALMGERIYFPTPSGLMMHAAADGRRLGVLPTDSDEEVLQNPQPTPDGLLLSGQHGFYLLPDPEEVQFATVPGVLYDLISTRNGLVMLTSTGQFFIDGRDAKIGRTPMLGLLELKSGEWVSADAGKVQWGDREITFPELKSEQVIMVEISSERIVLSQLGGTPQLRGVVLIDRDGTQRWIATPASAFYVAPLARERGFLVYTKNGAHRYDCDGQPLGSFGQGVCFPALDRGEFHTMDETGAFYDEAGRKLGHLPFTVLMSAVHWRDELYVLGRVSDGRHLAGRIDLASGRFEPLDLPASRTLVELRVQDDALIVLCEGEVLQVKKPRFLATPAVQPVFSLPDGGALPAAGLSPAQRDVRVTMPAPRLGPWQSPSYAVRVGDGQWQPVDPGATILLPRLEYGVNEVTVRAEIAGLESRAVHFVPRARPWWLDWPGVVVGVGGAIGLVVGLLRWRTRVLERRNQALERTVSLRTEQLRRANAFKNQFIARMNHEIRNPMNGLVGVARIIESRAHDGRDAMLADSLRACTEQLRATLDDVLDFSSLEEGKLMLAEEDFEVLELVRTTCRRFDVGEGVIRLLEPLPAEHWCHGDHGKLRLVLGNYLSNARKYGSPARADVAVELTELDAGQVRLKVSVSNPGPTLSAAELAGIFQPYQRGSRAQETGAEGTGLGLVFCRRYAELMGGSVGVQSADHVTTFWIEVPLRRVTSQVRAGEPVRLAANLRALAIEDERYNRLVLGHYLAELGLQADWATNFAEAMQLVTEKRYDVILSDWSLPDMTGGEALARFRTKLRDELPPVIVISAHATAEMRAQILAAGAREFLSKPVSLARLRATLAELNLSARRAETAEEDAGLYSPVEAPALDTGLDFSRLLLAGPVEEVLPRFRQDFLEGVAAARALVSSAPVEAGAKLHALRSLALLVRATELNRVLGMLEQALPQGELTPQEVEQHFCTVDHELGALLQTMERLAPTLADGATKVLR